MCSSDLAVHVKMGDIVRKGEPLITLDSREPSIELERTTASLEAAQRAQAQAEKGMAAAEADAELASATFQRIQQLFNKQSAARQELDEARARQAGAHAQAELARARVAEAQAHVKAATAGVEAAQVRLSYVQITAPLDGYVAARLVDPGAVVAPGMPLLQVERGGNYRLEVAVPESRISAIPVGSSLAVDVEAIDLHSTGRVIEIQPVLDANSRTALVRVQLPANERDRKSTRLNSSH